MYVYIYIYTCIYIYVYIYICLYIYIMYIWWPRTPLAHQFTNHGPSKYLKNWTTIGHPRQLQLTKVRPWAAWAVWSEWTRDILGQLWMMPTVRFSGFGQAQNLVLVRFCTKKGLKKCHLQRLFYVSTLPLLYLLSSQVIPRGLSMFEPYPNHHSQG